MIERTGHVLPRGHCPERIASEIGLPVHQKCYTPMSMVTRVLIREALEIHEGAVLVQVAEEREATSKGRSTLAHDVVWGEG